MGSRFIEKLHIDWNEIDRDIWIMLLKKICSYVDEV